LLTEWDETADQFQLIGGGIEPGESPDEAAAREFIEEIGVERDLEHGRDFEICPLEWSTTPPIRWTGMSSTCGVLTAYEVWVYRARLTVERLTLCDQNRWLTLEELMAGRTLSGLKTADPRLYPILDASLAGGLDGVPPSVDAASISNFPEHPGA
jgi:8-oxo-dGTP pyrophosphatase MutT (NUDIX family)